jgi:ATP-dependent Clp protease ATP-binding subunit ClpA
LAFALFDDEDNMVRIDMSEYEHSHNVSRLIGAPPGYVGHEEGGQLTEAVRKNPFSVVLLDEIDKAHPRVLNVLLQILDDGRLTDGQGRTVDFSQTIIIMTSNHGSPLFYSEILSEKGQDLDQDRLAKVRKEVETWFRSEIRPELLGRIGKIVTFNPLTKEQAGEILDLQLENKVEKPLMNKYEVKITFDSLVKRRLLKEGFHPEEGARPLIKAIDTLINNPLSDKILEDELSPKSHLTCTVEDEAIVFK